MEPIRAATFGRRSTPVGSDIAQWAEQVRQSGAADSRVYELYDEYCHGGMDRREFLRRAAVLTAGGLAMAHALLPHYAQAQTISFTDERIRPRYVSYPSPNGNSGKMRGYLVQPVGEGPFPTVLVVHENRGLNPYIEDVARRMAVAGFLALAPDGLYPAGGYPGTGRRRHDPARPGHRVLLAAPGPVRSLRLSTSTHSSCAASSTSVASVVSPWTSSRMMRSVAAFDAHRRH
jgi:hypothetical protein